MLFGEYVMFGGFEGVEVVMWFMMCGVLLVGVVCCYCSYYLLLMMGIVMVVYELVDMEVDEVVVECYW